MREYLTAKNSYLSAKQIELENVLVSHFDRFSKLISKTIKEVDINEDNYLPTNEELILWTFTLYLLLRKTNDEVSLTVSSLLAEIYGLSPLSESEMDLISMAQAKTTAESIKKTLLDKLRKDIKNQIDSGVTDIREIKRELLKTVTEMKEWKAEQIARTETNRIWHEVQTQTYLDNGIEKHKWLVSSNPCTVCQMNANKIVKIGEQFNSGHEFPPVHPNCACGTIGISA